MSNFEKLINASDLIEWIIETCPDWCEGAIRSIVDHIDEMPSAQPEIKEIDYSQCADAMLKMWIDKVVTDGEYYHIMDKLNIYRAKRWDDEVDS